MQTFRTIYIFISHLSITMSVISLSEVFSYLYAASYRIFQYQMLNVLFDVAKTVTLPGKPKLFELLLSIPQAMLVNGGLDDSGLNLDLSMFVIFL